jgi:hypothetical protein
MAGSWNNRRFCREHFQSSSARPSREFRSRRDRDGAVINHGSFRRVYPHYRRHRVVDLSLRSDKSAEGLDISLGMHQRLNLYVLVYACPITSDAAEASIKARFHRATRKVQCKLITQSIKYRLSR